MEIKKVLLDLMYPPRCPICHDIVEPGFQMICGSCMKQLPFVTAPKCTKCGKPVPEGDDLCYDCSVTAHAFTEGMGIFLYNEVMRKSMHYFKYMSRKEYGAFYAAAVWRFGRNTLKRWNPQVIVPIPIHKSRRRERGYNQAEVVAELLAGYMGIPVEKNILKRVNKTIAQKELTVEERRGNLKNAFVVNNASVPWERVLLLDDIYTTGSTMDAAASALKKYGIREIYCLSVCIGKGFVIQ